MLRPRQRKQMQPARKALLLAWLAELAMLGECFGHATARLWHERIRPDLDRISSNRQFERLKIVLQAHGIPHERVEISGDDPHEAPGACGLRLLVSREQLDRFGEPCRKRCAATECQGAPANAPFGAWYPPRRPWFYRDPWRGDGLTRLCAVCHRAAVAERHRRGLADAQVVQGYRDTVAREDRLSRRRATNRIASARYARSAGGETARAKKRLARQLRRNEARARRVTRAPSDSIDSTQTTPPPEGDASHADS